MDPDLIDTYPVYFEFNQNYQEDVVKFDKNGNNPELEMGLLSPMEISDKDVDPYTGKVVKPRKKKIHSGCPCC